MADPTSNPRVKKGQPALTPETVEPLIERFLGNVSGMASALKVSRAAMYKFLQAHPDLMELVGAEKERIKDLVERSLVRKAIGDPANNVEPEAWAVCFYLKTQAKDRGYVERQELTGKDGADLLPPAEEIIIEHHAPAHPEDDPAPGPVGDGAVGSTAPGDGRPEAPGPVPPGPDAGLEVG